MRRLGCLQVTSNGLYSVFDELSHHSGLGSLQLKVGVVGGWLDWNASCLTSLPFPASLDIDMPILYIFMGFPGLSHQLRREKNRS